jgi:hypothetical protein
MTTTKPTLKLEIGTRVYNHGDMANVPHFGTIVEVRTDPRWGTDLRIQPDDDAGSKDYWVNPCVFSPVYLGHGGTRFVTEEAYQAWRAAQLANLQRRMLQARAGKGGAS